MSYIGTYKNQMQTTRHWKQWSYFLETNHKMAEFKISRRSIASPSNSYKKASELKKLYKQTKQDILERHIKALMKSNVHWMLHIKRLEAERKVNTRYNLLWLVADLAKNHYLCSSATF